MLGKQQTSMGIAKYPEEAAINLLADLNVDRLREKETNHLDRQKIFPLITNNMFQFSFEY
jgi:hypothetical protein